MSLSEWPDKFKAENDDMVMVFVGEGFTVLVETDKAIGVGDTEVVTWIPKSLVDEFPEIGEEAEQLVVPRWLAEREDWEIA